MCGIAGLFSKSTSIEEELGAHLSAMLSQLADRGPTAPGLRSTAIPRPPAHARSRCSRRAPTSRGRLARELGAAFGGDPEPDVRSTHALFVVPAGGDEVQEWLARERPDLRVMSVGERIEIYKEAVDPRDFVERFGLSDVSASHALGHTRMATESRVTTEHSHPFSTGLDLCLVHNGSLSNHNRLRAFLRGRGSRSRPTTTPRSRRAI